MTATIMAGWIVTFGVAATPVASDQRQAAAAAAAPEDLFQTSDACMACHNGLVTSSGEDVSIGYAWRASMMANSARDPYWQAAVRREVMDHPAAREAIEDECSICHMPMATAGARALGRHGEVFSHLPVGQRDRAEARLAGDGVGCAACHQITHDGLGTPESFTGGFRVDPAGRSGARPVFGPYQVDAGRTGIMRSASGFQPTAGAHVQSSELCATCHTLHTTALGPGGRALGRLPEQMPYLEWRHSAYQGVRSCQDCHMPEVAGPTPIASVLGEPRAGLSRHDFLGGNFFMLRMLNRYRAELGVVALPQEMEAAVRRTIAHLERDTARLSIENLRVEGGTLMATVRVENLAGHKFPTAYPSRRAWLNLEIRDASGRLAFDSGGFLPTGAIRGNDNDDDPARFEPHHREIARAEDVQIYESIMAGTSGVPTTGLLSGVRYVKDNRLLPAGFDARTAPPDIAVHGVAGDADFEAGDDRVLYRVPIDRSAGPFQVDVRLYFQPIGYRWAESLGAYDAVETRRFLGYYRAMAAASAVAIARASGVAR